MEPPKDAKLIHSSNSVSWIEEPDTICIISKKGPQPSIEEQQREMEKFRQEFGDKKFRMLIDITEASASTKEARDFAAEELPKITKAIAMISRSALGKMLANLFLGLKPPPYPTKLFSDEASAREWLSKF